ncbi:hypothetical protein BCT86_15295 [Vibrio breoganii]|uniref:WD40 repeat protein n=1 Tax=Vibrio breoganii TaxID=553239 RepID=A0AAN0XUS8_9VIBR|nr:hypothetical protein [Vibrio breoganii]ANO32896.1 hypothetical protein A6E01_06650 [Vibrio breoganii]PML04280.1 hypothetical protein BCT86_15295 [Vibrio breoganii]
MRRILFIFFLVALQSFNVSANENKEPSFDYPFLLGEWFITNPAPESTQDDFLTIRLSFDSNYYFTIDIQKKDYSVERWEGLYNASDDTVVLGLNTSTPQIYAYKTTHNRLNLNGITFHKALSKPLAGIWSSQVLAGEDILASNVQKLDLILQPDFVFMFRASGEKGQESIKRGIYYIENDHLVLLYENGETQSSYSLNDDTLTLSGTGTDMYAELARMR